MSKEQEILYNVLSEPKGRKKDSPVCVDSEIALEAMRRFAKEQAIAFDKWKVEQGWEWSSSKWFKNKEVFWHQVPVGEYLTTDQLRCKFIEHQKQQSKTDKP